MTPNLLDLFCGGGGAGMGYHRAGFEVVGVDNVPQPRYPFAFIQADALDVLRRLIAGEAIEDNNGRLWRLEDFAVIHASPPCKLGNGMSRGRWQTKRKEHPDLIEPTIKLLRDAGRPYVVENVPGERHKFFSHLMLCGTMFGLQTANGNQLQRHRYFELFPHILVLQPPCNHNKLSSIGVHGGGQHPKRRSVAVDGNTGGSSTRDGDIGFGIEARREAMGIEWMVNSEITQAIPPAYTEYIGRQMLEIIGVT